MRLSLKERNENERKKSRNRRYKLEQKRKARSKQGFKYFKLCSSFYFSPLLVN
jgi:hypothetical protein